MDEIFGILISLIVDLVIVVLCAGFIGCMFCSDLGIEFDGGYVVPVRHRLCTSYRSTWVVVIPIHR